MPVERMRKGLLVSALILLSGALWPAAGAAGQNYKDTQYPDFSIRDVAVRSDMIIVGRIVRVMSVERKNELAEFSFNQEKRYEARLAWIEVDSVLAGNVSKDQRVKIVYPAQPRVPHEPVYDDDQQGIWLLRRSEKRGEYLADHPARFQDLSRLDQVKAIVSQIRTSSGNGKSGNGKKKKKKSK